MQNKRIKILNQYNIKESNKYLVYWMQSAQRSEYNHALEYAIRQANRMKKPLVVYFGLTDSYPEANLRHYSFMLEGLQEVKASLEERGIRMLIEYSSPDEGILKIAREASMVVVDGGYLKIDRDWRDKVARIIDIPLVEVETNVIVPVKEASTKEEYAAYTIRKKIHKKLARYLKPLHHEKVKVESINLSLPGDYQEINLSNLDGVLNDLAIDRKADKVMDYQGGLSKARERLQDFLKNKLAEYAELRNDPSIDYLSGLSPYLHFGQISPLEIALKVKGTSGPGKEDFLEELIVRRELAFNFVYYNHNYDNIESLPTWARETLAEHKGDRREYLYTRKDLEEAQTHDPYWNAAQEEMVKTGKMHGYMRMYWGKKILEWTTSPQEAYQTALYLNNKYQLDGRDPNGFAGIAWCFGKHDRAWPERPVFGKVRYMSAGGLERKFDIDGYVRRVKGIKQESLFK